MSKRKTQEEFEQEVYNLVKNEYTVLGKYIKNNVKLLMRHNCDKCNNYEWEVKPNSFLSMNSRCPKCAGNAKNTTNTFIKKVYDLVGEEYTILGQYKNNKTKIKFRHNNKSCNNYEFEMKPDSFISGQRCPKCGGTLRKTDLEFKQEVYKLVNNEYTVLNKYKNANTKVKLRHNCNDCNNYTWSILPFNFLNGQRCPKCMGNARKNLESFKQEVYELVGDEYTVLSEYNNSSTKIKMRHNCDKCNNYEFYIKPNSFLQGTRCSRCQHRSYAKTTDEYKNEVYNLVKNEYSVISNYKNLNTKIKFRHNNKSCNYYEFEMFPRNFLNGNRCPKCNESKGEKKIENYLNLYNIVYDIQYKFNNCRNKKLLSFDFAIFNDEDKSDLKCLIEYQGIQHYEPVDFAGKGQEWAEDQFKQNQIKDNIKRKYCKSNNIKLIEIPYWDFDNIESILTNILINTNNKYIMNNFPYNQKFDLKY